MVLQTSLQVASPQPHRLSYHQTNHITSITIIAKQALSQSHTDYLMNRYIPITIRAIYWLCLSHTDYLMVMSQSCIQGLINTCSIFLLGTTSSSSWTLWVSTSFQTLCHYRTSFSSLKARKLASSRETMLLPNPHGVWETIQFGQFTQNCATAQSIRSLGNYPVQPVHTKLRYYLIHTKSGKLTCL